MLREALLEQKPVFDRELHFSDTISRVFLTDTKLSEVTVAQHDAELRGASTTKAQSRYRCRRYCTPLVLASVVSLVAVLALLAQCHAPYKKEALAGLLRRDLSWHDAGLSEILDDCLDMSEEFGFQHINPPFDDDPVADPATRIAQLASMLSDSAAVFQPPRGSREMAPSSTVPGTLYTSSGGAAAEAREVARLTYLISGEVARHRRDAFSSTPSSSGFHFPSLSSGALGVLPNSPGGEFTVQKERKTTELHVTETESVTGSASIADALPSAECSWVNDPQKHPYVRLPELSKGVVPRPFAADAAFSAKLLQNSPMPMYLTMRELFLKESLSAEDADDLMYNCELLINYAIHRLTPPLARRSPFLVCRRLAGLLMMFDYVVCTAQIVGPRLEAGRWWPRFVNLFRMDHTLLSRNRMGRTGSDMLLSLAYRLIAALEVYKTGARPPAVEVVQLKRLIFSELREYSQFDHPSWNQWIEDDEKFTSRRQEDS